MLLKLMTKTCLAGGIKNKNDRSRSRPKRTSSATQVMTHFFQGVPISEWKRFVCYCNFKMIENKCTSIHRIFGAPECLVSPGQVGGGDQAGPHQGQRVLPQVHREQPGQQSAVGFKFCACASSENTSSGPQRTAWSTISCRNQDLRMRIIFTVESTRL